MSSLNVKLGGSLPIVMVLLLVVFLRRAQARNVASETLPTHEPNITVRPFSHRVPANSRVTFFCQASGHPAPTVFWRKNNRTLTDRRNRYIKTEVYSSVLSLESVGNKQAGVYQCVADNGVGRRAKADASLFVYDNGQALPEGYPAIREYTNSTITLIEKGFPMSLVCTVSGNPLPQVIWYKDKIPVDVYSSNGRQVVHRPGVRGSHNLRVLATEKRDHGDYVCMGRNVHGTVYSKIMKVYIKVRRYAPTFTIRPDPVNNVMAGGSLNLTCVAVGSPMPYVRWSREGERLGEPSNPPIGRNVLSLTNIKKSQNYTCTAQSGLGTIMVSSEVRVQALPDAPGSVWVDEITSMSAKIQWTKSTQARGPISNGDPKYVIQFRTRYSKTQVEWSEQGEDEVRNNLVYTLSGLQPYTIYDIRVVPYIEYGRGTPSEIKQFRTAEAAPESAPYDLTAKPVSVTTALVQWKAPLQPNGAIEGYEVLYCLTTNAGQPKERWMLRSTTGTSELVVLNGLRRNELYSVSVQARNRVGTGPYSQAIQFTMVPGVPLAPGNLQVRAKTSRTITLEWERPQGTQGILSYEIYINNSKTRTPIVRSVVPPQEEYILEDLSPNTVYNIKITARSEHGEGPHTDTIQVKTKEAEPSSPPLNIQAKAPELDASAQLKVTWEAPSAAQANGVITGYKLYYMPNTPQRDDSTASIQLIDDPRQTFVVLDNLQVWTMYRIRMKASTSVGDSPLSQPVLGRTGQDVPDALRAFTVMPINSSAVVLSWRKPTEREAKGKIRGYQVYWSELDAHNVRIAPHNTTMIDDGTIVNTTVGGLKARTKYVFQMMAYTVAGDGKPTRPKTVETLGAVPTAPLDMRLEIIDEDPPRVRVTWSPPSVSHGTLRSYRLMWGKRRSGVLSNTASIVSTRHSHIADRMMKGTEYEFRLQAQNDENYGVAAIDYIRTEDGVPSGSPQNITARYRTDTSAVVSWQQLDPGLRNGIITMYQVRYQDKANTIDLRAQNTSETSIRLDDLKAGATYFIQVVAFTSAGAGPTSHRVAYNTLQSRPPAPLAVTGERIDSTSIKVRWQAPLVAVSGYKIHYSTEDTGPDSPWAFVETHQPTPTHTLTGLDAHRAYAIKVQAVSPNGEEGVMSVEAIVNKVIPPELAAENVRSLTTSRHTSTSVLLKWNSPSRSGAISYRMQYRGLSRSSDKVDESVPMTITSNAYDNEKLIEGLKPDYDYTFDVLVKFQGDSDYRGKTSHTASTKAVATPRLKNDADAAIIALSREENKFDVIYIIVALKSESRNPKLITLEELQPKRDRRALADEQTTEQPVPAARSFPYIAGSFDGQSTPTEFIVGDDQEYGQYLNRKLAEGQEYKAFVRVLIAGDEFSSEYSTPFTSNGPVVAAPIVDTSPEPKADDMIALILGPIGGGFIITMIIVTIVVVIRRNKTQKKEQAPEPTKVTMDQPPVYPNDPVELRRMQFSTPGMQSHPPIQILQLSGHIEDLRAHDNVKFSQEYESIEPGQQFTWDNSNLEYNKPKNRYANVIAYDHSRVVLQPVDGIPGSDYINANYMDGYRKQNAYISTQGPLPETFGDFWRMIWEQRSTTLVMMTKLEERARVKCDAYWPSEGSEMYGPIIVTLTDCMELATYTVRTFQIEREGWAEKREVRQFQFTAWPDHGVPDYPTPLLIFMRRVKAATPADSGPMIVHCSAGVGRTGAFIVIDAMLERIKHEKTVDIYGHVTCLRAQRNYMVQTEDQYIFIHDALLEAVLSGNTEIPARNLYTHIQRLTQPDGASTGMEKEFKMLSNTKVNPSRFASANLPVNKFKNRLVNVLPYECNRVCLQPIRGVDGSDYVNASFIDGYRFKKAYIATQGPLAETAEDFWRMMWEHNSTIVVMLTKTREMGREKCHQYWPETRSARYQYFVVDPHAEYNMPEYTLREFKVTDARDGQSRTVRLFQFNDWPEQGQPQSGMSFIQFIGQVHKTKEQFGQEGPITVHCSAGVGRTGVFISLSIILERMRYEGVVDMFQTVKMLRTQRQGMVQTEEQYSFCYQAALEHLASFDHY